MTDVQDRHSDTGATGDPAEGVVMPSNHRGQQAWLLYSLGSTWDEVAVQVGYSTGSAACRAARNAMGELPVRDVEESRAAVLAAARWTLQQATKAVIESKRKPSALQAQIRAVELVARVEGVLTPDRPYNPVESEIQAWLGVVRSPDALVLPEEASVIPTRTDDEVGGGS